MFSQIAESSDSYIRYPQLEEKLPTKSFDNAFTQTSNNTKSTSTQVKPNKKQKFSQTYRDSLIDKSAQTDFLSSYEAQTDISQIINAALEDSEFPCKTDVKSFPPTPEDMENNYQRLLVKHHPECRTDKMYKDDFMNFLSIKRNQLIDDIMLIDHAISHFN